MTTDRELMQQAFGNLIGIDAKGAEVIEALRARLAQPEPEPVAWLVDDEGLYFDEVEAIKVSCDTVKPLYTAPPKREWQGLTLGDLMGIMNKDADETDLDIARAIETKLKEKNNG